LQPALSRRGRGCGRGSGPSDDGTATAGISRTGRPRSGATAPRRWTSRVQGPERPKWSSRSSARTVEAGRRRRPRLPDEERFSLRLWPRAVRRRIIAARIFWGVDRDFRMNRDCSTTMLRDTARSSRSIRAHGLRSRGETVRARAHNSTCAPSSREVEDARAQSSRRLLADRPDLSGTHTTRQSRPGWPARAPRWPASGRSAPRSVSDRGPRPRHAHSSTVGQTTA